jgi:hypothetical protein
MGTLYELDELVDDDLGVSVRFFTGGEPHPMRQVRMSTLIALVKLRGTEIGFIELGDFEAMQAAVREAFPTADASGEIDKLTPQRVGELVQLITEGKLATQSGNASTASADPSSASSRATAASTAKTPKPSGKGSKTAR